MLKKSESRFVAIREFSASLNSVTSTFVNVVLTIGEYSVLSSSPHPVNMAAVAAVNIASNDRLVIKHYFSRCKVNKFFPIN